MMSMSVKSTLIVNNLLVLCLFPFFLLYLLGPHGGNFANKVIKIVTYLFHGSNNNVFVSRVLLYVW
jgi:hypothetical protein